MANGSLWMEEVSLLGLQDWTMVMTTVLTALFVFLFLARIESLRGFFRPALDNKLDPTLRWWKDEETRPHFVVTDENEKKKNQEILYAYNELGPHVTHFCFLIHGHRGLRRDLSYLHTVMELLVDQKKVSLAQSDAEFRLRHDMVVHNAVCNEHRTTDGVVNGGERLVVEMLETIREAMKKRPYPNEQDSSPGALRNVTISIVGNSLGGIYGRYAIAQLERVCGNKDLILDGKFRLCFNIFCTTASPHLGVSKHTYVRMPRTAEIGLAHTMGNTGKDLFRLNDVMKTMATTPAFLAPLSRFRKRIAYANAYGTDFPVPTETAAFLSAESRYPHHFVEDSEKGGDCVVVDGSGLVIATMHTPRKHQGGELLVDQENTDDLAQMSHALDSLGWKKVFIDIRNEIPLRVSLPRLVTKRGGIEDSSPNEEEAPLDALKQKRVVESRDVVSAVTTPCNGDVPQMVLPIGHNMIIAFSRDRLSTMINKGGRPIVDALAEELVSDIFTWQPNEKNDS